MQALSAGWKISLTKLPAQRSAPEKVKLAAAMKRATSVSNGWLAERLQMGSAASASQYVRRFRLAGGDRAPEFQRLLSKVQACPVGLTHCWSRCTIVAFA